MSPGEPRRWLWPAVFAACVTVAGLVSVALGKDANWDLKNYHWYNAWALLHDRLTYDVAPAQLQTYHNPLADLPFYGLVHAFEDPRSVAFLMALPVGVAAFFLLRILFLLFPFDRDRANGVVWIAASTLIGFSGTAGIAAWGATFNEWPSIALAMAALWLAIRGTGEGGGLRPYACLAGGFLMGCAVGLKLTFAVYALGYLAACLAYGTWRDRLRRPVITGVAMAAGFLVTYGWWGWILWRDFANPFFPYFNSIFQSPWWEPIDFFDPKFGPRNWRQWIFFPLYLARDHRLVGEASFRDYRLAVLFVLAIMCWLTSRWRNLRENPNSLAPAPTPVEFGWRVLGLFALVSYLAWLKLFGIYRYAAGLEVISGALIVGCVMYLAPHGRVALGVVLVLTTLLITTTRIGWGWGRIEFGKSYFDVAVPSVEPGSLIILGYVHPLSYAAPFLGVNARFASPANNFLQLTQNNLMAKKAEEVIRNQRGPLYLLQYEQLTPHDHRTLQYFGLVLEGASCRKVTSSMDADAMRLCRLHPEPR